MPPVPPPAQAKQRHFVTHLTAMAERYDAATVFPLPPAAQSPLRAAWDKLRTEASSLMARYFDRATIYEAFRMTPFAPPSALQRPVVLPGSAVAIAPDQAGKRQLLFQISHASLHAMEITAHELRQFEFQRYLGSALAAVAQGLNWLRAPREVALYMEPATQCLSVEWRGLAAECANLCMVSVSADCTKRCTKLYRGVVLNCEAAEPLDSTPAEDPEPDRLDFAPVFRGDHPLQSGQNVRLPILVLGDRDDSAIGAASKGYARTAFKMRRPKGETDLEGALARCQAHIDAECEKKPAGAAKECVPMCKRSECGTRVFPVCKPGYIASSVAEAAKPAVAAPRSIMSRALKTIRMVKPQWKARVQLWCKPDSEAQFQILNIDIDTPAHSFIGGIPGFDMASAALTRSAVLREAAMRAPTRTGDGTQATCKDICTKLVSMGPDVDIVGAVRALQKGLTTG